MGNSQNHIVLDQGLKGDRLVNLEPKVTIGITGYYDKINPLGLQKVRFGEDGKLKELKSFNETDTTLIYEFTDNARLQFIKSDKDIMLKIQDPTSNINTTKQMCPTLRKFFKRPAFGSPQFDKIEDFIK
jgi:hypothetical protein